LLVGEDVGFQSAYAGAAEYFDWRRQQQVFEDMGLTRPVANFNLTGVGEPERLQGARVTASLFSTLRATPLIGRTFTEDEQLDPKPPKNVDSIAITRSSVKNMLVRSSSVCVNG
jgi:hypothetical protein